MEQQTRRTFLQLGGSGLAALASRRAFGAWVAGRPLPERNVPVHPVLLGSSSLRVALDREDGLPFQYRLLPGNESFRGEDLGQPVEATLCHRKTWEFSTTAIKASSVKSSRAQADFHFDAAFEGKRAVSFAVRYLVEGATDGIEVARDLATFCPLDAGRVAFYALTEQELSAPLPRNWSAANISAIALSAEKPEPFACDAADGVIRVRVPARRPVIVLADGARAKKRVSDSS